VLIILEVTSEADAGAILIALVEELFYIFKEVSAVDEDDTGASLD